MNLSNPYFIILLILTPLLQTLSSPAASSSSTKGFEIEQKTRLGSTPPSCHSKCNGCHPCFAVQVPTLPSHDRLDPSLDRVDHRIGHGFLRSAWTHQKGQFGDT
ncbi:unnamed protein product [Rhodiola kirilowii]